MKIEFNGKEINTTLWNKVQGKERYYLSVQGVDYGFVEISKGWWMPNFHSTECKRFYKSLTLEEQQTLAQLVLSQDSFQQPKSGDGLTSDELLEAVQRGYLTQSQAMNTDF